MSDVELYHAGSLIGFTPVSESANRWFKENIQSEGWQWMGGTLWVDHRVARNLLDGIVNSDLKLGSIGD